jgi:hypothetical protein
MRVVVCVCVLRVGRKAAQSYEDDDGEKIQMVIDEVSQWLHDNVGLGIRHQWYWYGVDIGSTFIGSTFD